MTTELKPVTGIEFHWIRFRMILRIWWMGAKMYRNPLMAIQATRRMFFQFSQALKGDLYRKGFKINGKYGWDLWNPVFPGKAFDRFFSTHLREQIPAPEHGSSIRRIMIAITKKCPLQCEHCSEWDSLNEKDVLRLEDLEEILDRYVNQGAAQIIYSGGEPLHRYGDLLHLIKRYSDRCDQWIYSSGYQLNETKAMELESAGLNGVAISLDHHSEVEHNKFRGNSKSYHWVKAAIENCRNSGLLTALNCCPTLSYLHEDGIPQLVERAKSWNVPIVNILEPRAVGHYAFMDVEYKEADMQLAASQVRYFNSLKYKTHPIVLFPAMYRKEVPCGGGKNYLFIDYDGSVMPCPFCKTPLPKIKTNAVVCDLELQMV